jgi:subtilisin-like proprotein convertase family protein
MHTFSRAFRWVVFLSLTSAMGRAAPAQSLERYVIHDSGLERTFEAALDEIAVVDRDGRREVRSIASAADMEGVVRSARALRAQTGQRTELILYEVGRERNEYTRRYLTGSVLVELEPSVDVQTLAADFGARTDGRLNVAPNFAVLHADDSAGALSLAAPLRGVRGVLSAQPLLAKLRAKKWAPNDTLYSQQWHLNNTGQGGGTPGVDVRVTNVWNTYRGSNILIAIVDDGLQITHTDLYENVNTQIDYDWNDGTPYDPSPDVSQDFHGSSCAGVAAARGNNGRGVSGAAPYATLVGLRLIAGSVGDTEEAAAMAHSNGIIHIKSNSWGPNDDGRTLEGPGSLTKAALSNGCYSGRGGLGVIYTWAAGNGLDANDNANYDGYANSMYTIAISAITDDGIQSWYSEPGACIVVAAPSSGGSTDIITTDLMGNDGYNYTGAAGELADVNYTKTFGGTSSATPLAAGVIALLLEANPNLGWRDVQEILIRSATKNAASDTDWKTNSAGFRFNHKYGAGLINAQAAIALATNNWTNLGTRVCYASMQSNLNLTIPDNSTAGVVRTFNVTTNMRVEHVLVTLDVRHTSRGQLEVELTSPSGFKSRLAEKHSDTGDHYANWTFSSVRHWGEQAQGTWSVRVADRTAGTIGTQRIVKLEIYGTALGSVSNQPPVLDPIGNKSGTVSNLLQFTVSASDPIDGDAVQLWATNVPAWASFSSVTNVGSVTNTFSGTPATAGTYTVYFFASDKDGTNSETINITIAGGGASTGLNIGGWTLVQSNSLLRFRFPTNTIVPPGGYVVLARSAGKSQFESFWGVTLGANVVFVTSTNQTPTINGGENYHLLNESGVLVDGPTPTSLDPVNNSIQRWSANSNATDAASWQVVGSASATPGSGCSGDGTAGLVISEYSDAVGTGAFSNEFVELYYDAAGSPSETPPILNPIGDTSIEVSNTLQFAVTAQPTDGDPVTLSVSNAPAGSVFVSTNENGTFYFTPTYEQIGVHTATFYAADNDGVDSETIRITVTPPSQPPSSNVLVYYDFDLSESFSPTTDSVAAYVTASNMTTRDGTYTNYTGTSGYAIGDVGWTGPVHYFAFAVSVSAGHSMNISGLRFADRASATGPTGWRIRSSADGYATDLAIGSTHTSFTSNDAIFVLSGVTSITFRIHGDNAPSASGTWRLDDVYLLGEVVMSGDDSDGDGLPDSWETAQFGSLSYGPGDDPDGDGQNNLEEMVGGTQPTNAASFFAIDSIQFNSGSRVQFLGLTGRTYRVLYATNLLGDATWTDLTGGLSGSNGLMSVTDTNDAPSRLYRVRATMP